MPCPQTPLSHHRDFILEFRSLASLSTLWESLAANRSAAKLNQSITFFRRADPTACPHMRDSIDLQFSVPRRAAHLSHVRPPTAAPVTPVREVGDQFLDLKAGNPFVGAFEKGADDERVARTTDDLLEVFVPAIVVQFLGLFEPVVFDEQFVDAVGAVVESPLVIWIDTCEGLTPGNKNITFSMGGGEYRSSHKCDKQEEALRVHV